MGKVDDGKRKKRKEKKEKKKKKKIDYTIKKRKEIRLHSTKTH